MFLKSSLQNLSMLLSICQSNSLYFHFYRLHLLPIRKSRRTYVIQQIFFLFQLQVSYMCCMMLKVLYCTCTCLGLNFYFHHFLCSLVSSMKTKPRSAVYSTEYGEACLVHTRDKFDKYNSALKAQVKFL